MIYLSGIEHGSTSVILNVPIYRSDTGQGMTGLTNSSSGLSIAHSFDNLAPVADTSAATSSIETISALYTYATPTSGFVRFKEIDSTSAPGMYQIQFEDSVFATASAKDMFIHITGVTDMMDMHYKIQLDTVTEANITALFTSYGIPTTTQLNNRTLPSAEYNTYIQAETTLDQLVDIEAKVDIVDTNVDSVLVDTGTTLPASLTAIEADTQNIQSRIPASLSANGNIDANIAEVNDVVVTGTGTTGDPWGP